MLLAGWGTPQEQMWVALAAYAAYVVNAVQFLKKFQQARASSTSIPFSADEMSVGARV
jgi:3-vinyl bacteriochlorophyllide hydratase